MLKTFAKGGVHPPDNKLSSKSGIEVLPPSKSVIVSLSQHLGAPAKPVVKKGDEVKVGQLIAESGGFVSANIHSPVSGKVLKVDKALDSSGYKRDAVFINADGDEWLEGIDQSTDLVSDISLGKDDIIKKIADAGIVGLGGATFPAHVKLSIPRGKTAEYLVINGAECEPYLTADHILMLEKGRELLVGIKILMKALEVDHAIVGIENNKPDAISNLKSLNEGFEGIKIQALKEKYPQGGEKQLIKAVIGREVPSGGLPIDIGAVVFNIGTVFAVYEAVQKNKPLVERVVTITGKALSRQANFKVRIGTPFQEILDAVGGLPEDTGKIINGGPMMGRAMGSIEVPVSKGSSGLLLLREEESKRKPIEPCIRCAKCVGVCPMGLEPYLLMTLSEKSMHERLENDNVMDCIECGSCSYTCPSNRPLLDYIRLGKGSVGQIIRSRKK